MNIEEFVERKLCEPNQYKITYIAFLDILGFKEKCSKKELSCEEIKAIFNDVELLKFNFDSKFSKLIFSKETCEKTTFTIMSDSIVISAPDNDEGLSFLLYLCSFIHNAFLRNKIMIRGGIAKGEFYKLNNIMYGPAFIDAYKLESETAIYPRTVIADDIIDDLKCRNFFRKKTADESLLTYKNKEKNENNRKTEIEMFIKQSTEDKTYFVNYFNILEMLPLNMTEKKIKTITDFVYSGLQINNARIRQKYKWLYEYFFQSLSTRFSNTINKKEQNDG